MTAEREQQEFRARNALVITAIAGLKEGEVINKQKRYTALAEKHALRGTLPPAEQLYFDSKRDRLRIILELVSRAWPGDQRPESSEEAEALVTSFKDEEARLIQRGKAASDELDEAVKNLKAGRRVMWNRPVQHAVDKLLEDYSVRLSQSYAMQLNGASCRRMVEQAEQICETLKDLLCMDLPEEKK